MADDAEAPLVMGVDLAANPANASAVCLLRGRKVDELLEAHTDDELVALAHRRAPALIALDAPLTPPIGLTGTYANRLAERELRAAGFRPLPPSMLGSLTFRGMRLLFRFQRHKVIEVFPRATLERLGHAYAGPKQGEAQVAACAALLARHVEGLPPLATDHAVDAVAAALTAALHLEGRTEGFGSSGEGLVWVPAVPESSATE